MNHGCLLPGPSSIADHFLESCCGWLMDGDTGYFLLPEILDRDGMVTVIQDGQGMLVEISDQCFIL